MDAINTMLTVTVVPNLPTSVTNDDSQIIISLFPNPATTAVTINFGKAARCTVEVCNMLGERLTLPLSQGEGSSVLIDVSQLSRGIYFVTVKDGEGNKVVRKIVK